jgi:hypothetical protein
MDIYFPEKYIMEMLKIIKPRTDHHVQFVHKIERKEMFWNIFK